MQTGDSKIKRWFSPAFISEEKNRIKKYRMIFWEAMNIIQQANTSDGFKIWTEEVEIKERDTDKLLTVKDIPGLSAMICSNNNISKQECDNVISIIDRLKL